MLTLRPDQLQQIIAHAERTYPEECCGILLGTIHLGTTDRQPDSSRKALVEAIETVNAWSEEASAALQALSLSPSRHPPETARRDRYWIDPQDLLQAQKQARQQDLQIIGIYHSHPDHPAIPSETDRVLAWAEYSYLIVSVQQGKGMEARSWQLNSTQQFEEEMIVAGEPSNVS